LVWTLSASAVTPTGATLNGMVNPNGCDMVAWFQWGTTTNYGSLAGVAWLLVNGTNAVPWWASLAGLSSGTTYHFRVVATNLCGAAYGSDQSFTTAGAPTIVAQPRTQTAEAGVTVDLGVAANGSLPLFCQWCCNGTNLGSCSTNCQLELTGVQFDQSGAYTAVITNAFGAVTSSPAMLRVIAPVSRRPVPAINLTGSADTSLNLQYTQSLIPAPNWTTLGSVSLTARSRSCFDTTQPLPAQRFYRAWQTGAPSVIPSLDLHMVPPITLTGNVGGSVRVDCINRLGPIDAWVTLDMVTLTNTLQLYFDVSAPGQPERLYRLVPLR
jgi:hypothetical protein